MAAGLEKACLESKSWNLSGGADGAAEDGHQLDDLLVFRHALVVVSRLKCDGLDHRRWRIGSAAVWRRIKKRYEEGWSGSSSLLAVSLQLK